MAGMQTSPDEPKRSGSRWEPDQADQPTEVLNAPPASPGTPVGGSQSAAAGKGLSTTAALVFAILLGVLAGAVAGAVVVGNRDQPVSVVDTGDQGQLGEQFGDPGQFGDQGQGRGQGRHGFGEHDEEY